MVIGLAGERVRQRRGQKGIDVFCEGKTDQKADNESDDRNDEPFAQFDKVIEQRRFRRFDCFLIGRRRRSHVSGPFAIVCAVSVGAGSVFWLAGDSPAGSTGA